MLPQRRKLAMRSKEALLSLRSLAGEEKGETLAFIAGCGLYYAKAHKSVEN